MSEPTTTAALDWMLDLRDSNPGLLLIIDLRDRLVRIEAEARQQERERLRAIVLEYESSEFSWSFIHDRLLADPESREALE